MIFALRDSTTTDCELARQCPTPQPDVTITPVPFQKEVVKPVETPVVQDPIDIPPASSFDPFPPTLRSRIRDRFQGRVGTNKIEDFLINRQRRFQ